MILYIGNSEESIKKLLELTNKFSKVAGYKINIQKSAVFLYPNSKLLKKKLIKQSIYNSRQRTKFLGINLTKEVKDLYSENYKLIKLKKRQIKEKIFHVHELESLKL